MDELPTTEFRQMFRVGAVAQAAARTLAVDQAKNVRPVLTLHDEQVYEVPAAPDGHVLYKDGDKDLPKQICDANGAVVLAQCRNCRKAEVELEQGVLCSRIPVEDQAGTTTRKIILETPTETIREGDPGAEHIADDFARVSLDRPTGTGLRYNQGKPPMELVPIRALAEYVEITFGKSLNPVIGCLQHLARFQERDVKVLLHDALAELSQDSTAIFAEAARVFDYGRNKYHEWNWAGGFLWSVPLACAVRHLMAMADGQENDEESGLPHRGHVACNMIMLLTFLHKFPELDDRPPLGTLRKELPL